MIQRYNLCLYIEDESTAMERHHAGDYVPYTDHIAVLAEKNRKIEELKNRLSAMHALDSDGCWPSYGELALMYAEKEAEIAGLNKEIEIKNGSWKVAADKIEEQIIEISHLNATLAEKEDLLQKTKTLLRGHTQSLIEQEAEISRLKGLIGKAREFYNDWKDDKYWFASKLWRDGAWKIIKEIGESYD